MAIVDTHIHFYEVTRPGGVAWPPPECKELYRDVLPADYKQVAQPLGIVACGIVEASDLQKDNHWILDMIKDDEYYPFFVARLPIGTDNFMPDLEELLPNDRFVGVRGWFGDMEGLTDRHIEHLQVLADHGLTLDLLSRGNLHPKDKIDAMAQRVPNLRIIINHLAGAKGDKLDPQWKKDMALLASNPNVHMKFSSFFQMFINFSVGENFKWESPEELSAYSPHFQVLVDTFSTDRLVWGSDWPYVNMGGNLARQIQLAEAFLEPMGKDVRDKVMYKNALDFYSRQVP